MNTAPTFQVTVRTAMQRAEEAAVLVEGLTRDEASTLAARLRAEQPADPAAYDAATWLVYGVRAMPLDEQAAVLASTADAVVQPWDRDWNPDDAPADAPAWVRGDFFPAQRLAVRMTELGYDDEDAYALCSEIVGRPVTSRKDLTYSELVRVHAYLNEAVDPARLAA